MQFEHITYAVSTPVFRVVDRFFRIDYLEQLAFYQIAVQYVCKGEIPPVYIAAIETGGQFRSAVRLISEDVMKMARRYVYKMIDSYMEAESLDQYNGPDDELGVIEYYHFSKQLDEEDEE